ncbi:MAG TPA: WecB/TagA/CpsF family glycosyltransferase [Patescibacteria group bacterium]
MKKALNQAKILNISVNSTTRQEVLTTIGDRIKNKEKFVVFTPNPEIIVAASSDPRLASILNSADLSIPDGIGLKLVNPSLSIYKGRKLMLDLINLADSQKLKVYFLGASKDVNKKVLQKAKVKHPNLTVEASSGPMLDKEGKPVSEEELSSEKETIAHINRFSPQILFVAFGTPKEQKWIYLHKDELKANCIMEVGGAFDYLAGSALLPPKILESLGLEWFWRLINEPQRAGRIFTALVLFPIKVLLSKIAS